MEQYMYLSQIYDEMIDIDYAKWGSFVSKFFEDKGITLQGKKALELACGTGNMSLELKKLGLDIVAVDMSEDMLRVAQEKARNAYAKIMFVEQDMTELDIQSRFDQAFCFCDGFNYITDEDELEDVFKNVYNKLNPGGYLIFDISSAYKLKKVIGSSTFTRNTETLCYIWDNYIEDDILEMYITFFIKNGSMYERFDENHIQRAYETDYIVKCLERAGFKNIETFDDYNFKDSAEESLRVTFAAQREE